MLYSLGPNYRALVIGSTGALGTAFTQALGEDPQCAYVAELSRRTTPGFTLEDEASIAAAAVPPERMIFGSDYPLNVYPKLGAEPEMSRMIAEARAAGAGDAIMRENALRLFTR